MSPIFESFESRGRTTKWMLWLYPKGHNEDVEGSVSLFLHPETKYPNKDVNTSFEFSILDSSNELQKQYFLEFIFKKNLYSGYGCPNYLEKDELQRNPGWLKDENLTIDITLKVFEDEEDTSEVQSEPKILHPVEDEKETSEDCHLEVCNDLGKMFVEKKLCDVKIICEDETSFDGHANILAARSPVFRAMFQSDIVWKNERQVKIKGFTSKTVRQMLNFMYTGAFELNDKKATDTEDIEELLKAADQYLLESLKKICETILGNALDFSNCLHLLILGDMHQADQLKKKAMEFVVENMTMIINKRSHEWKRCVRNYPDLTVELMAEISEKMTKKM